MYNNLRTELHKKGMTLKQYAVFLGVGEKTVQIVFFLYLPKKWFYSFLPDSCKPA